MTASDPIGGTLCIEEGGAADSDTETTGKVGADGRGGAKPGASGFGGGAGKSKGTKKKKK